MEKAQARAFWAAANVFIGVDVSVCLNMLTRTWWHEERSLDMLEGDRGGVVCILIFGEILKKYVSPLHHISTEYFQNTVNSPQRNQCLLHGPILYVPASLSISGWYMRWMIFCRKKLEPNGPQRVASKGFVQPTGLILLTFEGWWQIWFHLPRFTSCMYIYVYSIHTFVWSTPHRSSTHKSLPISLSNGICSSRYVCCKTKEWCHTHVMFSKLPRELLWSHCSHQSFQIPISVLVHAFVIRDFGSKLHSGLQ